MKSLVVFIFAVFSIPKSSAGMRRFTPSHQSMIQEINDLYSEHKPTRWMDHVKKTFEEDLEQGKLYILARELMTESILLQVAERYKQEFPREPFARYEVYQDDIVRFILDVRALADLRDIIRVLTPRYPFDADVWRRLSVVAALLLRHLSIQAENHDIVSTIVSSIASSKPSQTNYSIHMYPLYIYDVYRYEGPSKY